MASTPAHASELGLVLNGKSIHLERSTTKSGKPLNEDNVGLGLELAFREKGQKLFPFLTGGGFKDSYDSPAWYAGGGAKYRLQMKSAYLDFATTLGVIRKERLNNGNPVIGLLPSLSFGYGPTALNVIYVPKGDTQPLVMLQMRANFNGY